MINKVIIGKNGIISIISCLLLCLILDYNVVGFNHNHIMHGHHSKHRCYAGIKSSIIYITSYSSLWYEKMELRNSMSSTKWENTLFQESEEEQQNLPYIIVYHEEDIPDIRGTCKIDMRKEILWLEYELHNKDSGLNKYYYISDYHEPNNPDPKVGDPIDGHILLHKVAAINHAIHSSKEGTLVMWVDTDVSFRKQLPQSIIDWLRDRDMSYIPMHLGPTENWESYNVEKNADLQKLMLQEWWIIESGLVVFTVNERSKALVSKAVEMYRGGMYFLAKACFNNAPFCKLERVRKNIYLNDIFVFSLLLQSDCHQDQFFNVGLKHGWFAMRGLPPFGIFNRTWGNHHYTPNFNPVHDNNSVVANFHIDEYIFHHFAYHDTGAFSMKLNRTANTNNTWRTIQSVGDKTKSLFYHVLLK